MPEFLPNLIAILVLAGVVALAVRSILKTKRQGGCAGGCPGCSGSCHCGGPSRKENHPSA